MKMNLKSSLKLCSLIKNEFTIWHSHTQRAFQSLQFYKTCSHSGNILLTRNLQYLRQRGKQCHCDVGANNHVACSLSNLKNVQYSQKKHFRSQSFNELCVKFSLQKWNKRLDDANISSPKKPKIKENIYTVPNLLTSLRLASAPVLVALIMQDSYGYACSLFFAAGITDMLDGYIARNFKNQRTSFGTALDPFADKVLMSCLTVSLTAVGLIPLPLAVLILGRDVSLLIGGFYIRWTTLAPPKTARRYFDGSHVTVTFEPSTLSKANTVLQLSFIAATLAAPVFDFVGHPSWQAFMYLTGATTFLSGADYMLTWRKRLKVVENQ